MIPLRNPQVIQCFDVIIEKDMLQISNAESSDEELEIRQKNFNGTTDWICSNEDSDSYGAVTSYDDYCIDYEPKQ